MIRIEELKKDPKITNIKLIHPGHGIYSGMVTLKNCKASVIFGYNENNLMEHVSISPNNKKYWLSWNDMCEVKDMFFNPNEMVVQIHPTADRYLHGFGDRENILHLWRPKDGDFGVLNHPERWD